MPTGRYTDYLANKILDHVFGGGDFTRPATIYLAALKASDVEVSGGSYARVAVTNNGTNFPGASSRAKANANAIPFAQATADWGFIEAIGIYDASSGGNLLAKIPLAGPFKNATAAAATDVLTSASHGFSNGQRVRVEAMAGLSLPGGLAASTTYWVRDVTTNTFKLAASDGGGAIDLSTDAALFVHLYKGRDVFTGDTLSFGAGDLAMNHD